MITEMPWNLAAMSNCGLKNGKCFIRKKDTFKAPNALIICVTFIFRSKLKRSKSIPLAMIDFDLKHKVCQRFTIDEDLHTKCAFIGMAIFFAKSKCINCCKDHQVSSYSKKFFD